MRTHEGVLRHNYETTEKVEAKNHGKSSLGYGLYSHATKFMIAGHEVMERRLVVDVAPDGKSCILQNQYNALGSFHEAQRLSLTATQFEYLKSVWHTPTEKE